MLAKNLFVTGLNLSLSLTFFPFYDIVKYLTGQLVPYVYEAVDKELFAAVDES